MNPKCDFFFNKNGKWQSAYEKLRSLALNTELTEELKWGVPCYTINKTNVVLIHGFKEYCALLFHKGVMLKDKNGILIQQTENVQAGRQLRFSGLEQLLEMEDTITAYLQEAIAIEKSGLKVEMKPTSAFNMPEEFERALKEDPKLKAAFEGLTPGRQRGYLLYFSGAKQAKTRESRIEKYYDHILSGKGLDD